MKGCLLHLGVLKTGQGVSALLCSRLPLSCPFRTCCSRLQATGKTHTQHQPTTVEPICTTRRQWSNHLPLSHPRRVCPSALAAVWPTPGVQHPLQPRTGPANQQRDMHSPQQSLRMVKAQSERKTLHEAVAWCQGHPCVLKSYTTRLAVCPNTAVSY